MLRQMLTITTILITASTVLAENANDIIGIKETARNYMESWYQGDAKKMKESLHKKLAKRSLMPGYGDKKELRLTSASDMISYTKTGYGERLWEKGMEIEVIVLDYYKNIASVKVITKDYYEYLHLIKTDKKWVILNAVYEKYSP